MCISVEAPSAVRRAGDPLSPALCACLDIQPTFPSDVRQSKVDQIRVWADFVGNHLCDVFHKVVLRIDVGTLHGSRLKEVVDERHLAASRDFLL
jgi:hypothetical protein